MFSLVWFIYIFNELFHFSHNSTSLGFARSISTPFLGVQICNPFYYQPNFLTSFFYFFCAISRKVLATSNVVMKKNAEKGKTWGAKCNNFDAIALIYSLCLKCVFGFFTQTHRTYSPKTGYFLTVKICIPFKNLFLRSSVTNSKSKQSAAKIAKI